MDPRKNPFAPGAGTIPPELAGRSEISENIAISLDRCRAGLAYRGVILVGLRGVGKTVLLAKVANEAEAKGFVVVSMEAPEKRSLPALLVPALRSALIKLDRIAAAGSLGKRALKVLGAFVGAMKLSYQDIELAVNIESLTGVADSGDLEHDLSELLVEVGAAAQERKTAVILCIDEIQYIPEEQFAALIMALHKCSQKQLPITIVGAGLPQLVGQAGRAKSYAERLFEYPELGPLPEIAAKSALEAPAKKLGVAFTPEALEEIMRQTQGYPYFIQEWGKYCWQVASSSPIRLEDVEEATKLVLLDLDASFFRVRIDRLTAAEKKYLRAMASLGGGPYRSGDIAALLQKDVQTVAPTRASLIAKGMIYSLTHGECDFTVPLFDGFLKRLI